MPSLLCYGARGYCRCNWELTLYPNTGMHILHTVLYVSQGANKGEFVEQARAS